MLELFHHPVDPPDFTAESIGAAVPVTWCCYRGRLSITVTRRSSSVSHPGPVLPSQEPGHIQGSAQNRGQTLRRRPPPAPGQHLPGGSALDGTERASGKGDPGAARRAPKVTRRADRGV
jgi:hypothetical protein